MLADATTSVLAIGALIGGKLWQWNWLDPLMGVVGALLVSIWAYGLVRDTSKVLLDREMDSEVVGEIRQIIEAEDDTRISDLHLWRVGREQFACIVAVVAEEPRPPEHYKNLLEVHEELVHITDEVFRCPDHGQRLSA